MSDQAFFSRFGFEMLRVLKKCLWLVVPVVCLLLLVWVDVLSSSTNDLILMLSGVLLMILGLPLSAALRVDELSVELGHAFPREAVLLLALLVAVINISFILGVRGAILKSRQEIKHD